MSEALEEYALASAEEDYENTGQRAPMEFMAAGREFNDAKIASHWEDQ